MKSYRERGKKIRDLSPADSPPKWSLQRRLGHTEVKRQELLSGLLHGQQGPKHLSHALLLF